MKKLGGGMNRKIFLLKVLGFFGLTSLAYGISKSNSSRISIEALSKSGEIISCITYLTKYYDEKRLDVIDLAYKKLFLECQSKGHKVQDLVIISYFCKDSPVYES